MTYKPIDWQGFEAHLLENDVLRVVTVPQIGGKIVSIWDKHSGHEWLVSPKRPLRLAPAGSRFSDYDLSGWDEMFPTINACEFIDAKGMRRYLPDHGELWTQAWTTTNSDDIAVSMRASGVFQPYTLERRIEIDEAGALCLDYILTSQAASPFPFIWAAHPLFRAFPESRVRFTPAPSQMMLVSALPHTGFKHGARMPLSPIRLDTGETVELLHVGQPSLTHSRKFYLPEDQRLQSVRLEHPHLHAAVELSWSGDAVRYFGLWIDERTHSCDYVLAPEPCTGYYDDLAHAHTAGNAAVIQPGEQLTWTLRLRFTHLDEGGKR